MEGQTFSVPSTCPKALAILVVSYLPRPSSSFTSSAASKSYSAPWSSSYVVAEVIVSPGKFSTDIEQ